MRFHREPGSTEKVIFRECAKELWNGGAVVTDGCQIPGRTTRCDTCSAPETVYVVTVEGMGSWESL